MRKLKKALSLVLAIALVLGLCTIGAAAAGHSGEYITVDTYDGSVSKTDLTVKVVNASGDELETIGPFETYRSGSTMTISLNSAYYGVYELEGIKLEKGNVSNWSGSFNDSYEITFTWSSIGNSSDTMTVTLKEAEHTLKLENNGISLGTIAYKEGLQRTNVNVYLNYEPFVSFEDVHIANSLNNFVLSLNDGYYYGVADNNLDYSSEIPGQTITYTIGNGDGIYNKLTFSVPSTSVSYQDKLNTIDLYMFTYDDGIDVDFTRAINDNPAHLDLANACEKLDISFTYGGNDYTFEYTEWDQTHKAFLPYDTLINVTPDIKPGYSFDCWKTNDAWGDHANSLYTILEDGTLHEETGAASMEGVYAYSESMAFKYASGFTVGQIILKMVTGSDPYTITYHSNIPGNDTTLSENFYTGAYIDGNSFTYPGHEFLSWNTAADGNGTTYQPHSFYSEKSDLVLYAQWDDDDPQPPVEYVTLTYDANGGTGAPDPETVEKGTTVDLTKAKQPTHDDVGDVPILFVGWTLDSTKLQILTKDSTSEDIPQLSNSLQMDKNYKVYAVWAEDRNGNDKPDYQETDIVVKFEPAPGTTSGQTEVTLKPFGTVTESYGQAPAVTAPAGQKFVKWQLVGGDAADTLADKAYFTYDIIFEMANGASSVTFNAEYENLPASETYPVYVVIYRNGDTDEAYKSIKLDDYDKGDSVELSELDIADYYSSAYGFAFEGWYNDGGWNQYKAGNPNNKLGDSITVNGWTNIRCMVTDYEKVVVKSVIDGDKDNAETIYTGEALHGTNLIDFLDEKVETEDKPGYELDKWYNWDWYGHKYSDTTTVNGWTNVYVTYTSVEPDAPTAEDLAALKLKVQIDCIDLGVHPNRDYAIEDGTFTTDVKLVNGEWQCALSVEGSAYLTKYNAEFGKHEFSGSSTKTKTLVYGAAGWTLENPSNDRIVFDVRCVEPEAPTYDVLKDMIKVQIDCINKEVSHSNADYDLIENSYDLGTLTANADGTWSCTLTVKSDAYIAKYNETQPGHTLADAYASKNVALVYSVDGKWSRADTSNNIAAVFDVKCDTPAAPNAPTEDELKALFDGKVFVDCVAKSWHPTYGYGLLANGYTVAGPVKGADGEYTCTVTLLASAYLAEYNGDVTEKHALASYQGDEAVALKWTGSAWTVINGELPVTFDVVCDTWYPPIIPPATPSEPDYTPNWLNTTDHVSYIIGYEDGTVKPNAGITRAEVATIFFRLLTDGARERFWSESNAYSDVAAGSWYNIAVSTLSNMGILGGYEDGTFRPNASITRAEFAKIAVSFFDWADVYAVNSFVDVRGSAWYAHYVAVAAELGLIEGYGGNVFRPDATITRAEACTIINRTLGRAPDADHLLPVAQMNTWPDNSDTGVWYYAQIQEATNSHDYRWLGDIEQWTAKLADPDWDKLQY